MPEMKQVPSTGAALCCYPHSRLPVQLHFGVLVAGTSPRGEAECPEGPRQGHGWKSWGAGLALLG